MADIHMVTAFEEIRGAVSTLIEQSQPSTIAMIPGKRTGLEAEKAGRLPWDNAIHLPEPGRTGRG
jgi:hypothetical protein